MRLVLIPLLAALVGVSTLSPSLPAAEGESPPKAEGEGDQGVKPGDQAQRAEAQRQREEAKRRNETGKPAPDSDRGVRPGDTLDRSDEAKRRSEEAKRREETGKPGTDGDRTNMKDNPEARLQERIALLKKERPEPFKRLDLNGNGELSPEELRRPRELFTQRQQARQKAGNQDGSGVRTDTTVRPASPARPAQAKGAERPMPAVAATDEEMGDFLFGE